MAVLAACSGARDEKPGGNGLCRNPDGSLKPAAAVCRPAAGTCDLAESCTGTSPDCPPDVLAAPATTCRPAAGPCDVAETCSGASAECPSDAFAGPDTTCRAAAGSCDVAETCTGTDAACPADLLAVGTICRAATGACDATEFCSGAERDCPADEYLTASVTCRPAAAACDAPETCTGTTAECPPDVLAPATTICRASAGPCDRPDYCTGSAADCPADALVAAGTTCRASAGPCDVEEQCDGVSGACPADVLAQAGHECRPAAGPCDVSEACSGSSAACPADGVAAAGTTCRAAASSCDVAEQCDGIAKSCPSDVQLAAGGVGEACCPGSTCLDGTLVCGATCECDLGRASCDGNGSSCEVDLTTDPENCGACGHSCAGGACAASRCQPLLLADSSAFSGGSYRPVAFDPAAGFYGLGYDAQTGGFQVARMSTSGEITILTHEPGGLANAHHFVLNSGSVYFVEGNALKRVSRAGGSITTLVASDVYYTPVADEAYVYFGQNCSWSNLDTYIGRIRVGTLQVETIVACNSPQVPVPGRIPEQMLLDGTTLYYTMDNGQNTWDGLYAVGTDGSNHRRLYSSYVYGWNGLYRTLLLDGGRVYYGGGTEANVFQPGALAAYDVGAGTVSGYLTETCVGYPGYCETWGIAADAEKVYFTVYGPGSPLYALDKATGQVTQVMTYNSGHLSQVFVDDRFLYTVGSGGVWRLVK